MNNLIKILSISFLLLFFIDCSSNKKFEKNYQKCKENRYRCDTIYYYFKNVKNEERKVYLTDTLHNRLQTVYWIRFKKSNKYFYTSTKSHYKKKDLLNIVRLYKTKVIEKDKSFLREYKNQVYTYDDFKNMTTKEINLFYYRNKFNIKYLIDKTESKNGKIYLKSIALGGNFPKIQ